MANYYLVACPDDVSPLPAGDRMKFDATSLAAAQGNAQAHASLWNCNLFLEDPNTPSLGVVRTKYVPAGGATVNITAGVSHRKS